MVEKVEQFQEIIIRKIKQVSVVEVKKK